MLKNFTLFIYSDALNFDVVNDVHMPFLSSLADSHSKKIENTIGYSFAIQSCMLSGKYPNENDHWLPYFYSPDSAPLFFKFFGKLSSVLLLDHFPKIRCLALQQLRKLFFKKGVPSNNMPSQVIDKFGIYPYYYMSELPFFKELQSLMADNFNSRLTYLGPPMLKNNIYSSIVKHVNDSTYNNEFILAYDDKLDFLGHRYGPSSKYYLQYVHFLDSKLNHVYNKLIKKFDENLTFVVFSDHGQCDKTFVYDILSALRHSGMSLGKDYLVFVDATMAFFWFEKESVKQKLSEFLSNISVGKLLNQIETKQYNINFNTNKFGCLIFVLKPGGTFFPNFFSPFGTLKGLHGYLPEDMVQKAFLISSKSIPSNFSHVKDFRDFALTMSCSK